MKTAFLQGGLFFDGQNNQPLWKKNMKDRPELDVIAWDQSYIIQMCVLCMLIYDFHQNREWACRQRLVACLSSCLFIHLFSFVVYSYERKSTPHCIYRTWPKMWAQLLFSKSSYFLIFFCFFSSWLVRDFKTQSARPLFELLSNCFSVISSFDVGKIVPVNSCNKYSVR